MVELSRLLSPLATLAIGDSFDNVAFEEVVEVELVLLLGLE
jgi:hypothetical protein